MEQDIINQVCSLKADTLGEVFKKFCILITDNNEAISSNIDSILSSFIPQNNLQKLFKLRLIDKWKRTSQLIRIFEEDDVFYISRALKCKWFFSEININATDLVNSILPNLSYSSRVKFLRQCSFHLKDVNKAEEIFKKVQQRYGTECALTLLPACSPNFVRETLHNNSAQIKPIVIVPLFEVHPKVIIEYFLKVLEFKSSGKRLYRNFSMDNYANIFKQIATTDSELFVNTFVKYNQYFPYMNLGNRTSKKIIKNNAPIVIKHYKIFMNIIKRKNIIRYMSYIQIEELQLTRFPKTVMKFFQDNWKIERICELTSHMKEDKRQEIFFRNFKKCYGREFSIEEFESVMDLHLILYIPTDMRIKWIESKIPSLEPDSKKAEYLSYLPPEIALPKLKEMIGYQKEFNIRAHMVKCMMVSIRHYKDSYKLLRECIEFVNRRLRNDNVAIREKIFDGLVEMEEALFRLTLDDWTSIDALIDLVRMNDETQSFRYNIRRIMAIKIQKMFQEGGPVETHLKKLFDFDIAEKFYDFSLCKGTAFQKSCLEFYLSTFPTLTFEKENDKIEAHSRMFDTLCEYNSLHKNDTLDYPEWLLLVVENLLVSEKQDQYSKRMVLKQVRKIPQLKYRYYFKVFPSLIDHEVLKYILQKKPLFIKEHIEDMMLEVLNSYLGNYASLFKQISLYVPFDLPLAIRDFCISILNSEDLSSKWHINQSKPNCVLVLSLLLSPTDYIQLITPYKPNKEVLDPFSEENHLQYRIQTAVASSLKHVYSPSAVLSYIKSFAVGDYLKLIIGSINSVCLKVPEKKILPILIEWLDCPVSLRKHFIRAYYKVAPIADTGNLIVTLLSKEKNRSLRLLLLEHIYKYFLAQPCDESFTVFKIGYSQLTSEDVAAVDNLFDCKQLPDLFMSTFIKMLWDAVELKEGPLVGKNKDKIINMIDADILGLLSEELCNVMLKHIFSGKLSDYMTFITNYLLFASNATTQKTRLEKVSQHISLIVEESWNDYNIHSTIVFQTRDAVYEFIENICRQSLQDKNFPVNPANLLENLKLFVTSLVPTSEILDELLRLEITIFVNASDKNSDIFISQLAKFYENQLVKNCSTYGDEVIARIVSLMPYCLEENKLQLAKVLVSEYETYQAYLMAIRLIDTNIDGDLPIYREIIDFFVKCTHPFVKVAAGDFLRSLRSNVQIE